MVSGADCDRHADGRALCRVQWLQRKAGGAAAGTRHFGFFVPETMFSGETGLHALLGDWRSYTAGALLLIAVLKGLLSALCINLGWRGGNIFPIIYMGAAAGYACAQAVNLLGGDAALDGGFAVALVLAAMYGFLSQKPVTVIAVLLLCFPVTYILPIAVAAFVSAKVSQWFSRWRSREA